ncbi:MAG: glycine cleavage system protein T [Acidimicrobiia bacterium]|nr:glycine cleavage system protein T [Actinomycetota bacterium]MBL6926514.1 glycine cleavage system protein T [Acidimicrobiia bacterium]
MSFTIGLGARIRKSPFYEAMSAHGMTHASVYNKMVLPESFGDPDAEYKALVERVSLWDVACERQVEVVGPDAFDLVQYVSARDMAGCAVGRVRYAPICDHQGTLINDPMILKLAEDRFWFSIADSDLKLWIRAIGAERGLDCRVFEPDVSPLGVQGPRAEDVLAEMLGEWVRDVPFFGFVEVEHEGIPFVLCRSGWSGQGGFELFLTDGSRGNALWNAVWAAGERYGIHPGGPMSDERIESGLFSYGTDCGGDATPLEVGLGRFLSLDREDDFVGKSALLAERERGPARRLVTALLSGERLAVPSEHPWPVFEVGEGSGGDQVGTVRSAVWSPKHGSNLALALVTSDVAGAGFVTVTPEGDELEASHLSYFGE